MPSDISITAGTRNNLLALQNTTSQTFTASKINALKTGAGNLTLADMNQEGANLLMLQTRQSLGITSLSMASQTARSILKLF
jgi:flagellin